MSLPSFLVRVHSVINDDAPSGHCRGLLDSASPIACSLCYAKLHRSALLLLSCHAKTFVFNVSKVHDSHVPVYTLILQLFKKTAC